MDKIHEHNKELIACEFTETSVDLIVSDFEGVNHRLRNDLGGKLDVEASSYQIKDNQIYLKMKKGEEKEWLSLAFESEVEPEEGE